jgi:hypothetical protein
MVLALSLSLSSCRYWGTPTYGSVEVYLSCCILPSYISPDRFSEYPSLAVVAQSITFLTTAIAHKTKDNKSQPLDPHTTSKDRLFPPDFALLTSPSEIIGSQCCHFLEAIR